MKCFIALILLFSTPLFAAELDCEQYAARVAARYADVSLEEFRATTDVVWSCRALRDPRKQEIQYSDGSTIIGVPVIIINGQCALYGSVYTVQDDQDPDRDPVGDSKDCLE